MGSFVYLFVGGWLVWFGFFSTSRYGNSTSECTSENRRILIFRKKGGFI